MGRSSRALLSVVAAMLAACSGTGGGPAATPTPDVATQAPSTPAPVGPTVAPTAAATPVGSTAPWPETLAVALTQTYNTGGGAFDPTKVGGLDAGKVNAWWYTDGNEYVIVFSVDLAATGPLCPGSSVSIGGQFKFASNAPSAKGGCDGDETQLKPPPVGVLTCTSLQQGLFAYLTAIPDGTAGMLFATIEKGQADGSIMGLTGGIKSTTHTIGRVDLTTNGCTPVPGL